MRLCACACVCALVCVCACVREGDRKEREQRTRTRFAHLEHAPVVEDDAQPRLHASIIIIITTTTTCLARPCSARPSFICCRRRSRRDRLRRRAVGRRGEREDRARPTVEAAARAEHPPRRGVRDEDLWRRRREARRAAARAAVAEVGIIVRDGDCHVWRGFMTWHGDRQRRRVRESGRPRHAARPIDLSTGPTTRRRETGGTTDAKVIGTVLTRALCCGCGADVNAAQAYRARARAAKA